MNTDLRERFESSFPFEPPHRPVEDVIEAGRKGLRRRRVATAAALTIAAGVVVLGATQLDGSPLAGPQPIGQPTEKAQVQAEERLTRATPVDATWKPQCAPGDAGYCETHAYALVAAPVVVRADGTLVRISDEVTVAKRVADTTPPVGTLRLEVEVRTPENIHSRWYIVLREATGRVVVEQVDPGHIPFDTWASGINDDVEVPDAPPRTHAPVVVTN
jgi:hypothetical protein